ncbi:hypothetical protein ABW19_dt0202210 [Dactylella cylindrospora]|nr:hypothetical protein ABW19_dt0202210 [Dactylella cylindrospora]
MNVAYRLLEAKRKRNNYSFHPFIEGWSHHATTSDMMRSLTFPDVNVSVSNVVLIEGDFTKAFKDSAGHYDVVITHFFIDTARNLMSYFDNIHRVLRKGGYWINFGPLLYGSAPYVQLSLAEILDVVEAMGFEFMDAPASCGEITLESKKARGREAVYAFNLKALTKNAYNAQMWITRKL